MIKSAVTRTRGVGWSKSGDFEHIFFFEWSFDEVLQFKL